MGGALRHLVALGGAGLVAAVAVATGGGAAHASPAEVFGFGSRHAAAGAEVASVYDFAAVYYNPAGLAAGDGSHATIGGLATVSNLHVDDRRVSLSDPIGTVIGITVPAPLGGPLTNRVRIGAVAHLGARTRAPRCP